MQTAPFRLKLRKLSKRYERGKPAGLKVEMTVSNYCVGEGNHISHH